MNTHWLNHFHSALEWLARIHSRFFVIQIGFLLFGQSIVILVKANLGNTPWVVLEGFGIFQITCIRPNGGLPSDSALPFDALRKRP